jgi:uncharacterized membrane protein
MDPTLAAALGVLMRWIHIVSVVLLVGGFIYARFVLAPALASIPAAERESVGSKTVDAFRPWLIAVVATTFGSGVYNYATKASYPPTYHMWMGIKLLLVLHIYVSAILYSVRAGDQAKRNRTALSIAISGVIVIAIADYLRYLSLR